MSANGIQPTWRGRTRGGVGIAAAVGLVVLLVGNATAAPTSSSATAVTRVAPYSGSVDASFVGEPTGCDLSANYPVLPYFNLTAGQSFESVKGSAHSCGTANSTLYLQSAAGFTSTPFTTSAGVHHLTANWVLNFSISLSAKPGTGKQEARSAFAVYLEFELVDLTSFATFYQANYPEIYGTVTSGTHSQTYPGVHEAVYLNATLVKGHSYDFEVEAYVAVEVFVTPGTSAASASVNMGSGGRNAFLASVIRN